MKPTVLYFAPVAFFKGGAENSLQDLLHNPAVKPVLVVPAEGPLSEQAKRDGIKVEVVPFGAIEEIHRPLKISKVAMALVDAVKAAAALKQIAKKHGAICLHTNGMKAHMLGMMARVLGGAPVVAHVRDIAYTSVEKLVWKTLAVGCYRVLVVSRACWPAPALPGNVLVVHNGIALPELKLPAAPKGDKPLRLGFCGRIDPIKGLELLLGWMAAAKSAKLSVTLTIRGHGEAAYEAAIVARAKELGLGKMVVFEGPQKGLKAVFAELDAVVVPSQTPDPLPRSVMEAMAVGLPVIGYPAGGIPDMIKDGESGFLVRDELEFVRAVKALQDGKVWTGLQKGGRARVVEGFSLEALYRNLAAVYAPLMTSKKKA